MIQADSLAKILKFIFQESNFTAIQSMPADKRSNYIDHLTQNPDAFLASQESSTPQAHHALSTSNGSRDPIPPQGNDTEYAAESMQATPQQETVTLKDTNNDDDVQITGTTDTNQVFKPEAPHNSEEPLAAMLDRNINAVINMSAEQLAAEKQALDKSRSNRDLYITPMKNSKRRPHQGRNVLMGSTGGSAQEQGHRNRKQLNLNNFRSPDYGTMTLVPPRPH